MTITLDELKQLLRIDKEDGSSLAAHVLEAIRRLTRENTGLRLEMASVHEALEHTTELLVDTWGTAMDSDPEREAAVRDARKLLAGSAITSQERRS